MVTEGKSDWKHLKAAQLALSESDDFKTLFEHDFEILEYDDLKMGGNKLASICRSFSQLPQSRPIIFIADSDNNGVNNQLQADDGSRFKNHGNGVYSLTLPTPPFRDETQGICIEEMYPDEIIQTEIDCRDGIKRRLYLTDEFDEYGRARELNLFCPQIGAKNNGTKGSRVIDSGSYLIVNANSSDGDKNLALSKDNFARYMLENALSFHDGRFEPFGKVFESIQSAISDWHDTSSTQS
ncbi:MAG: hypothetical protein IJ087_04410 [Eggerthellaceae bacterium]|nr:hypothetical protein [Eggerthellaceae bacterium]